jgi:hypothetical protein
MAKRINTDPEIEYLLPLVGGVITQVLVDDQSDIDENCYGLRIEKNGKKFDCLILRDPEGNGPGHLMIMEDEN